MRGNHLRMPTPISEDVVNLITVAMLTSMTIVLSGAATLAMSVVSSLA